MIPIFAGRLATLTLFLLPMNAVVAAQESAPSPRPDLICASDVISPALIDHNVDEVFAAGALQESFNFLDYHFEKDGRYMQARAYLDDIETVVIFGPYESDENPTPVADDAFRNDVVAYLKRRFSRIEEPSEGDGFNLVWEWSAEETPDLSECEPIANNQQ